ncbi:Formyl transferase, C-terminal domain, partial [Andreprevotia lacus DSM 23236]
MTSTHVFRCILIGETTLPEACAERLQAKGHEIAAVVTRDTRLQAWAQTRNIPQTASVGDLPALLAGQAFDHLFSIVNPDILPPALLAQVPGHAINYHDGPLPRYAGMYATSWALINGETRHAISWHLMQSQIDAGAVLQQTWFDIDPDDTALSLNAKCYAAALQAFDTLIDELAEGALAPQPQDTRLRSFFAGNRRPEAGCSLDWSLPADKLADLVRALQFGPYPNPLGTAKLLTSSGWYAVTQAEVLPGQPEAVVGTVLASSEYGMDVATGSGTLRLSALTDLAGKPFKPADLDCTAGTKLPLLPTAEAAQLSAAYAHSSQHEAYWRSEWQSAGPLRLPHARGAIGVAPVVRELTLPLLQHGRSPATTAATFVAWLARITQLDNFSLGYRPAALQTLSKVCKSFFVPSLPLFCQITARQTFAQLGQHIEAKLAELAQHGVPARDIVQRYPELRSQAGKQMQVAIEIVDLAKIAGPLTDDFAHVLLLQIASDGSRCRWVYDAALLSSDYLPDMLAQWQSILLAAHSSPEQAIADLPLLDAAGRKRVLLDWNATAVAHASPPAFHQLFEQQVDAQPAAPALLFGDAVLSYAQLDARANQLAHALRAAGVGPDVCVGVCLSRSFELVIALLAILKAGGAYVPLDPAYPPQRLAHMLADASPRLVLAEQAHADVLRAYAGPVWLLDEAERQAELAGLASTRLNLPVWPQQLAYVIYTSGSTGLPKGTLVPQAGLVNLALAQIAAFGVQAGQRVLQFASFNFDAATSELCMALGAGATLVLARA